MNAEEISDVLAKAAAFDQRTVGAADILAWLEVVGDLDRADALEGVARHYRETSNRMMPADLRRHVKAIREERQRRAPHEIRELPSRFEADDIRDQRLREGLAMVLAALPQPEPGSADDLHQRAARRAKSERGNRPNPAKERRRRSGKLPDLYKVTKGPWWSRREKREEHALTELGNAGRLRTCRCSQCQSESGEAS